MHYCNRKGVQKGVLCSLSQRVLYQRFHCSVVFLHILLAITIEHAHKSFVTTFIVLCKIFAKQQVSVLLERHHIH